MSTMFSSFAVARSGMGAYKLWLDAISEGFTTKKEQSTSPATARGAPTCSAEAA